MILADVFMEEHALAPVAQAQLPADGEAARSVRADAVVMAEADAIKARTLTIGREKTNAAMMLEMLEQKRNTEGARPNN